MNIKTIKIVFILNEFIKGEYYKTIYWYALNEGRLSIVLSKNQISNNLTLAIRLKRNHANLIVQLFKVSKTHDHKFY